MVKFEQISYKISTLKEWDSAVKLWDVRVMIDL